MGSSQYGIYGTMKSYKINFVTTMGKNAKLAKLKAWLWVIFLPYRRMRVLFPILGKWPFLLPFCWIVRVVRVLKGDMSGKIKKVGLGDI